MAAKSHWDNVYAGKPAHGVSWYQERAALSLRLIQATGAAQAAGIIDIGGGASVLVDDLLAAGYSNLTVLDLCSAALAVSQERLGAKAGQVRWVQADITQVELPHHAYAVWHDRAVFHFLTDPEERAAYVRTVLHAVKPGGHVIVASFAEDGPERCSGLPVVRYTPDRLSAELGAGFAPVTHERESHRTPSGAEQPFMYHLYRKRDVV
ncbi:MAG: class I SAM-dependent methyltransferase [Betaproteobacteria bacterium]|nr:class I SAM-dependent methyltransferase [Betaproteobacteria bacterium]